MVLGLGKLFGGGAIQAVSKVIDEIHTSDAVSYTHLTLPTNREV